MELTTESLNLTLSRRYPVSLAPDNNPIVHIGNDTATVTAHDADLAWLNVRGDVEGMPPVAHLNIEVRAGGSLILAKSGPPMVPRIGQYHDAPCKSEIHRMGVVTFVNYPQRSDATFRVAGVGGGMIGGILRNYEVPMGWLSMSKLPSVVHIDPAKLRDLLPYLGRIFGGFNGEVRSGWGTETITPAFQHPGYGSYLSSCVSLGLTVLCSTIPVTAKRKLAELMVQWGLDLAGAFADGRVNTSNGGHMQGRKALIILAGYLLNIPQMADPDAINPNFQETQGYETKDRGWWWGGTWKHVWHPFGRGSGSFVGVHPATWSHDATMPNGNVQRGERFRLSYMNQVLGSQVGTALAMRLMGLQRQMGTAFIGAVGQWMEGPPENIRMDLASEGMTFPWGTDYTVGPGAGICADAWRSVGGMVLP